MSSVAIVIPCFNLGRFVEEALNSVLRQTRPVAEVVIIDDGSTDPYTRDRLDNLNRSGVRVVRTPNRGANAARNHGIRLTSSEYLVVLDADDRLLPEYVARTAARLDAESDVGFVTTAIRAFGDAGYNWSPPSPTIVNAFTRGSAHPASLFRRSVWSTTGGFDESLKGCQDVDFWLSAMEHGIRGVVIDEPLLEYRVRTDSVHHALVSGGGQLSVMEGIFRKHEDAIAAIGPSLVVEKDRFLEEQRAHRAWLIEQRFRLESELRDLDADILHATNELGRRGSWAEIDGVLPFRLQNASGRRISIEQFYIRSFLSRHLPDRRGTVVFIQDGPSPEDLVDEATEENDIPLESVRRLHPVDLPQVGDGSADCVIALGVFEGAWDSVQTVTDLARVLRPGGVLLCALAATRSQAGLSPGGSEYWRFTEAGARHLFARAFPPDAFTIEVSGNVLVCAAALAGCDIDDLTAEQRDTVDPMFPLLYCVRALKS